MSQFVRNSLAVDVEIHGLYEATTNIADIVCDAESIESSMCTFIEEPGNHGI